MSDHEEPLDNEDVEDEPVDGDEEDQWITDILEDPSKKLLLIEKLGLGAGKSPHGQREPRENPTLSGKSTGSTPGVRADAPSAGLTQVLRPSEWLARVESLPGPSGSQRTSDASEEDPIHLLSDSEALELVEFDPSVTPENSWKPPTHMA